MRIVTAAGTPTITASSAYASGNCIGSTITLSKMADFGFSTILSVTILDKKDQKSAIDVWMFNQPLATPQTDKTAVAITAADLQNCIGHISFLAADYSDGGSTAAVATKFNLWLAAAGGVDNNIYAQLVSRGTPTYGSTSDITLRLTAQVDKDM